MNEKVRPSSRKRRPGTRRRGRPPHKYQRRPESAHRPEPKVDPALADLPVQGVLELVKDGSGFLRKSENSYQKDSGDTYVHPGVVHRYGLLAGSEVKGMAVRQRGRNTLATVETIDGDSPEAAQQRTPFNRLTSIDPVERLRIDGSNELSLRVLDLITPIGKGQRGLIVASPRTGKTMLLQQLAQSLEQNHPEVQLMVALVDERPEEVTEMRRSTGAEVIHSSNDHPPQRHIKVVEMVLDRARRLVEGGRDVVILLDSLTRVARAYNSRNRSSGRTLSGGLDSTTMLKPREFFGAARKAEEGGSLTIIATALIDTGSRMDDVIFEEFKGTGNMELVLDRKLAERRIWPAINIHQSGTRKEEKLRSAENQKKVNLLRRVLSDHSPLDAMRLLLSKLEKTESNEQFLKMIKAG